MLSKLAVKRPVTMVMALAAVILLGFVSVFSLPQALLPDIEAPYAMVMVTYGGAGPEEIDDLVTSPVEEVLSTVEGVKNMMSVSSENISMVMLEFDMDTDLNFATLEMREKISMIQSRLPEEATAPSIVKMSIDALPVMQLYAASDMSIPELNSFINDNISPNFERISGVASVNETGATEAVINVVFDQEKLQGYGLSMSNISKILAAENISFPSGTVNNGDTEVTVKTFGEFQNVQEIEDLPITLTDGSVITLKDVATIEKTETETESITRIDGMPAIGLSINKTSDANVVEVSDRVLKTMKELEEKYEGDLTITIGYDQADFVRLSINAVVKAAIQGAIMAIIVIFLFLRNVRSTLVIAISIPTSIMATFCIMKVTGMSLNMLTMGALTLAVGMVVDNSVVVLENIFRRNKMGLNAEDAAIQGSREVALAVLASTMTSVVVYLPVALSGGMAGMIFKDFSITIIAALLCSLIVSITVVTMLCSKLLDNNVSEDYVRIGRFFYRFRIVVYFTKMIDSMIEGYGRMVRTALKKRKRIVAAFLAMFVISVSLIGAVGFELLPQVDEGAFNINVEMPDGTSLAEHDRYMTQIESYVMKMPEVEHVSISVGQSDSLIQESNVISVNLADESHRDRSSEEIMREVKHHFKDLAGAEITYKLVDSFGMTALAGADLSLNVSGNDADAVARNAESLYSKILELDCISDASVDVAEGNPEVRVKLNRSTAAFYGLTSYQIATGLSDALSGTTSTQLNLDGETIDVALSLSDVYAQSIEDMKAITIDTPMGPVPIGQIATLEMDNSPVAINKTNQENVNVVEVTFKDSVEIKEGTKEVSKIVDSFVFDKGVHCEKGGMNEEINENFKDLGVALLVSIALVYIVMAAQFESFQLPLMVMMSIPFAMSGAFLALFISGIKLSMPAFVGLIMLVGIVVNNAILLVEFINQNRETMGRDEAIAEAGVVRMRPILMTTVTTVSGMIPMALGIGEGTEMMVPMAVSTIGGLTASTLITLFIIPVLYASVDDWNSRRYARRAAKKKLNMYREALWLAKEAKKREEHRIIEEERRKNREERKKNRKQ